MNINKKTFSLVNLISPGFVTASSLITSIWSGVSSGFSCYCSISFATAPTARRLVSVSALPESSGSIESSRDVRAPKSIPKLTPSRKKRVTADEFSTYRCFKTSNFFSVVDRIRNLWDVDFDRMGNIFILKDIRTKVRELAYYLCSKLYPKKNFSDLIDRCQYFEVLFRWLFSYHVGFIVEYILISVLINETSQNLFQKDLFDYVSSNMMFMDWKKNVYKAGIPPLLILYYTPNLLKLIRIIMQVYNSDYWNSLSSTQQFEFCQYIIHKTKLYGTFKYILELFVKIAKSNHGTVSAVCFTISKAVEGGEVIVPSPPSTALELGAAVSPTAQAEKPLCFTKLKAVDGGEAIVPSPPSTALDLGAAVSPTAQAEERLIYLIFNKISDFFKKIIIFLKENGISILVVFLVLYFSPSIIENCRSRISQSNLFGDTALERSLDSTVSAKRINYDRFGNAPFASLSKSSFSRRTSLVPSVKPTYNRVIPSTLHPPIRTAPLTASNTGASTLRFSLTASTQKNAIICHSSFNSATGLQALYSPLRSSMPAAVSGPSFLCEKNSTFLQQPQILSDVNVVKSLPAGGDIFDSDRPTIATLMPYSDTLDQNQQVSATILSYKKNTNSEGLVIKSYSATVDDSQLYYNGELLSKGVVQEHASHSTGHKDMAAILLNVTSDVNNFQTEVNLNASKKLKSENIVEAAKARLTRLLAEFTRDNIGGRNLQLKDPSLAKRIEVFDLREVIEDALIHSDDPVVKDFVKALKKPQSQTTNYKKILKTKSKNAFRLLAESKEIHAQKLFYVVPKIEGSHCMPKQTCTIYLIVNGKGHGHSIMSVAFASPAYNGGGSFDATDATALDYRKKTSLFDVHNEVIDRGHARTKQSLIKKIRSGQLRQQGWSATMASLGLDYQAENYKEGRRIIIDNFTTTNVVHLLQRCGVPPNVIEASKDPIALNLEKQLRVTAVFATGRLQLENLEGSLRVQPVMEDGRLANDIEFSTVPGNYRPIHDTQWGYARMIERDFPHITNCIILENQYACVVGTQLGIAINHPKLDLFVNKLSKIAHNQITKEEILTSHKESSSEINLQYQESLLELQSKNKSKLQESLMELRENHGVQSKDKLDDQESLLELHSKQELKLQESYLESKHNKDLSLLGAELEIQLEFHNRANSSLDNRKASLTHLENISEIQANRIYGLCEAQNEPKYQNDLDHIDNQISFSLDVNTFLSRVGSDFQEGCSTAANDIGEQANTVLDGMSSYTADLGQKTKFFYSNSNNVSDLDLKQKTLDLHSEFKSLTTDNPFVIALDETSHPYTQQALNSDCVYNGPGPQPKRPVSLTTMKQRLNRCKQTKNKKNQLMSTTTTSSSTSTSTSTSTTSRTTSTKIKIIQKQRVKAPINVRKKIKKKISPIITRRRVANQIKINAQNLGNP